MSIHMKFVYPCSGLKDVALVDFTLRFFRVCTISIVYYKRNLSES